MIRKYDLDLYPMSLYIGTISDFYNSKKRFKFYGTVQDMLIDDDGIPADPMGSAATTFLVKEKKSGYKGVITFLDEDSNRVISEFLFNTIAHESTHITDAIWQLIGAHAESFDERNEPYAYLVGWVAGKIGQYMIDYIRDNE